eukprot:SM000018S03648  [mRNA]  locus=s18:496436:498171:+ [translate_table: standard]
MVIELATGAPPWGAAAFAGDPFCALYAIGAGDAVPPTPPALAASPAAADFLACCLRRDPAERWTAHQLLAHPFVAAAAPPMAMAAKEAVPVSPVSVLVTSAASWASSSSHTGDVDATAAAAALGFSSPHRGWGLEALRPAIDIPDLALSFGASGSWPDDGGDPWIVVRSPTTTPSSAASSIPSAPTSPTASSPLQPTSESSDQPSFPSTSTSSSNSHSRMPSPALPGVDAHAVDLFKPAVLPVRTAVATAEPLLANAYYAKADCTDLQTAKRPCMALAARLLGQLLAYPSPNAPRLLMHLQQPPPHTDTQVKIYNAANGRMPAPSGGSSNSESSCSGALATMRRSTALDELQPLDEDSGSCQE